MSTNFKIKALEAAEFSYLFALRDQELERIGAVRMTADSNPGFPCRVSMEDAETGEELILLNYRHHKEEKSPYRGSGAIFVRKIGRTANPGINEIPKSLQHRLLSLRGYNKDGMMKTATVTEGKDLQEQLSMMFENEKIRYIHIHNAKQGCYQAMAERV